MPLYAGIDLHSTNSVVGVVDERGRRVDRFKVQNKLDYICSGLLPHKSRLAGIVVESTYNWYWLVDGLMDRDYRVHLANPTKIKTYSGVKHRGDVDDAFWLADLLRLDVLPEGFIYPKEERPLRDLLRTRSKLVSERTGLIIGLKNIVTRNTGLRLPVDAVKALRTNWVTPHLSQNANLALSGEVLKELIDYLTRQIRRIEAVVFEQVKLRQAYQHLLTIPGVGKILGLTIMLETGPIGRFPHVGKYASYCRKVSTRWVSNDKPKARGNVKNGNRYLAWAFGEAAEHARRLDEQARRYYNRKMQKTNAPVAHSALAHKLARAAYWMIRNDEPFIPERVFG